MLHSTQIKHKLSQTVQLISINSNFSCNYYSERETDRQTERETERERERQTDRQTDILRHREIE